MASFLDFAGSIFVMFVKSVVQRLNLELERRIGTLYSGNIVLRMYVFFCTS